MTQARYGHGARGPVAVEVVAVLRREEDRRARARLDEHQRVARAAQDRPRHERPHPSRARAPRVVVGLDRHARDAAVAACARVADGQPPQLRAHRAHRDALGSRLGDDAVGRVVPVAHVARVHARIDAAPARLKLVALRPGRARAHLAAAACARSGHCDGRARRAAHDVGRSHGARRERRARRGDVGRPDPVDARGGVSLRARVDGRRAVDRGAHCGAAGSERDGRCEKRSAKHGHGRSVPAKRRFERASAVRPSRAVLYDPRVLRAAATGSCSWLA
jgi:hypothetical protein